MEVKNPGTGWQLEVLQTSAGSFGGHAHALEIAGIRVQHKVFEHATSSLFGCAPPNTFVACLTRGVQQPGRFNSQEFGNGLVAWEGGKEFESVVTPMEMLLMVIDRDLLEQHLGLDEHAHLFSSWTTARCQVHGECALTRSTFSRMLALLMGCFSSPTDLGHPLQQQQLQDALIDLATPLILQRIVPGHSTGDHRHRLRLVQQARQYAMDHITEPLRVIDLCRATGVSRTALQNGFHETLGICPSDYLRAIRLNGARSTLTSGRPGVLVKHAAEAWGFWHISRFGQDYNRLFGELPSHTLKGVSGGITALPTCEKAQAK
jgi:AraC family ethanolamine operon transcriptional activator